tara:strand:- start:4148 stop:4444 length:297 start_codon:yes stop_codon:yes gene_type:complete
MTRKHKGITQTGKHKGQLKVGYKYSGNKTMSGLPEIVSARPIEMQGGLKCSSKIVRKLYPKKCATKYAIKEERAKHRVDQMKLETRMKLDKARKNSLQ